MDMMNMMNTNLPITPFTANRNHKRHENIRKIALFNTEIHDVPKEGDPNSKVNENADLYDEDRKLASLLQSLSMCINHNFVPNGLLTHTQFVEFIDSLQTYVSIYLHRGITTNITTTTNY